MNDPKDVIAFYLQRIENASHPIEKRSIKSDVFLYYYRLTADEREAVRPQMQPLLEETRLEMEANDPILKRANDLLIRIEKKQTLLSD